MSGTSDGIVGGGAAGPWYRVEAITASCLGGTAERDYASVLPAALNAALHRRPFVAGWLSRGGGAPLDLITNAGPLPAAVSSSLNGLRPRDREQQAADPDSPDRRRPGGGPASPGGPDELLFPWGARGRPFTASLLVDLDRLVWAPCPGRQAPQLAGELAAGAHQAGLGSGPRQASSWPGYGGRDGQHRPGAEPTLFESALLTLMARPFGWLVVAEPTDLIDTETSELRTQLNVLRRYEEEHARFDVDRAQRRLAELDAYHEAGLWNVRVLAGAASEAELSLIAPVLVGSVDLHAHPYRLRTAEGARDLADALAATLASPADGSQVPFLATAGTLAALTGLPRREVPGVRVLEPGFFDVTSETAGQHAIELGAILDSQDRPVGTFRVPLATLNRHAFVTGATGSGKSQTVRHMLEQLTGAGIPWLAIEPVKSEYAAMAGWAMRPRSP